MSTVLSPIVRSVGDQVIEAPIESIFSLEYNVPGSEQRLVTALHRTGINGWLSTRILPGYGRTTGAREMFIDNSFVKAFIDNPAYDAVVRILESGPED